MSGEFEAKLHSALRNARPSSKNLSAFALDIEHYLEQTGLFSQIQLEKTGEPQRALLVRCQLLDPATLPATVIEQLERLWAVAPLRYGGEYDAYEFRQNLDAVQMNFVTVASYSVVVTGEVVVSGFRSGA
ncbi:MAG TPA: hypothetical protein VF826_20155 [Chloroflexia bacterium]